MSTITPLPELSPEAMAEALATVSPDPSENPDEAAYLTAYRMARKIREATGALSDEAAPWPDDWQGAVSEWAEEHGMDPDRLWDTLGSLWDETAGANRSRFGAALEAYTANPTAFDAPGMTDKARRAATLCWRLQEATGGAFFLGCRTLAAILGVCHKWAARILALLRKRGILQLAHEWATERGRRLARQWVFIGSKTDGYTHRPIDPKTHNHKDTLDSGPKAITREPDPAPLPEAEPEPALAGIEAAAALALGSVEEGGKAKAGKQAPKAVAGPKPAQAVQAPAPPRTPDPEPDPGEIRPDAAKTARQNRHRATITPEPIPTPQPDPVRALEATERACRRAVQAGRMTARAAFDETADTLLTLIGKPGDPEARRAVWRMRHHFTPWPEVARTLIAHYKGGATTPTVPVITRRDHDHPHDHGYGRPSAVERGYRLYCT